MGHFYFLLGLGGLLLLAMTLSLMRHFGRGVRQPFVADETLFSPSQRLFLGVLERAAGPDCRVFGRVRVAEVIGLRPRLDRATRRRAYAQLGDWQFDFLVCAADTGTILCAVNLEPRSGLRPWSRRDPLEPICTAAGLPFVRVREADDYAVGEIARRLQAAIQALRPPVQQAAPPPRRTPVEASYTLSEVALEDDREPRLRSTPASPAVVQPAAEPSPRLPESARRREPTLAVAGDLDLGPTFRIGGNLNLEDDRPARGRWT